MLDRVSGSQERQALTTVLRGSAVPYGYTLTVLASHSILANRHGGPDVLEILLFVTGAVLGFATLALAARARSQRPLQPGGGDLIRAGMIHIFAIGAAFGASVLIALIPGLLAWALGAFAATVLYLSIVSLELDLTEHIDADV
jgi:hypothetical protein